MLNFSFSEETDLDFSKIQVLSLRIQIYFKKKKIELFFLIKFGQRIKNIKKIIL